MKDFVLYPEALELKELGFDEPCFANYTVIPEDKIDWFTIPEQGITNKTSFGSSKNYNSKYFEEEGTISAPTYSQAFRWFREKGYRYTISSDCFDKNGMFYFEAWKHKQFTFDSGLVYSTYEEAELACLNKLIEIVKEQQK